MKTLFFATAISTFSALSASADSATPTNWSGFYGGLSASSYSGQTTQTVGGIPNVYALSTKSAVGVFAGYNWQNGHLVLGGELAYTDPDQGHILFPATHLNKTFDAKLRAGYATEKTLFYGVIGGSSASITDFGTNVKLSGLSYGMGVDYALTDKIVIGAEYLMRSLNGTFLTSSYKTKSNSISARLSWKF